MKIEIPVAATPYIIYQRTGYLKDNTLHTLLNRIGTHSPVLYKITVWLKTKLYGKQTLAEFTDDMLLDFETIKSHIPKEPKALLDIGSGIAGIDVLLSKQYAHQTEIHLLDKTATDHDIYYGFEDTTAYYNSLEIAKEILEINGTPTEKIFLHDADHPEGCFGTEKFDLITSFISWGFHYPISTYIQEVAQSLTSGGILIIDIRKGTDGVAELEEVFSSVKTIYETNAQIRVCATKE